MESLGGGGPKVECTLLPCLSYGGSLCCLHVNVSPFVTFLYSVCKKKCYSSKPDYVRNVQLLESKGKSLELPTSRGEVSATIVDLCEEDYQAVIPRKRQKQVECESNEPA